MIKIIESKLLVENKWDDLLLKPDMGHTRSIIQQLRFTYHIDLENSTFTKTDPNQLKEGQPILFIFVAFRKDNSDKLYYASYPYNIPGIREDGGLWPNYTLRTHNNGDISIEKMDLQGHPLFFEDLSFEELTEYCYAAYVVDVEFSTDKEYMRLKAKNGSINRNSFRRGLFNDDPDKSGYAPSDQQSKQMLMKVAKSKNAEVLKKFLDLYKAANDIVMSMPDNPPTTKEQNLRQFWRELRGDLQHDLDSYNAALEQNDTKLLAYSLNSITAKVDQIDLYRKRYCMKKLTDKYVK